MDTRTIVTSGVTMLVGGLVAAVTLVGLILNQVNAPSDQPGDVSQATIPYGTTQ